MFINSPGLISLIGVTRKAGFDIEFIVSEADLFKALKTPNVDVIGISSMERLLQRSIEVAKKIRRFKPGIVLMIGGNSIDSFAIDLTAGLFDIVVLGESEHTLPALLRALACAKGLSTGNTNPKGLHHVEGTTKTVANSNSNGSLDARCIDKILHASFTRDSYSHGKLEIRVGKVYVKDPTRGKIWFMDEPNINSSGIQKLTPQRFPTNIFNSAPLEEELDNLCIIPWGIIANHEWKHFEFYTQRGCRWGRCCFCSTGDRRVRALSPEKIADVISEAVLHGVEVISFADDLFVQNPSWNRRLLDLLKERKIKASYRAQTTANRTVWPLLRKMREVGFLELAFGVETLNPTRAEFMVKTFNGPKYVENVMETVLRTAEAGIYPVLYMIMADPNSSLLEIANELLDTVKFVRSIYCQTAILPKLSYSLMMLPVAGTDIIKNFKYDTICIPLQAGQIQWPSEFKVSPDIGKYLSQIANETHHMPFRRENISAMIRYLENIEKVAEEFNDPNLTYIKSATEQGLATLDDLFYLLDCDVEETAEDVSILIKSKSFGSGVDCGKYDYRRFGGYISGLKKFRELLYLIDK